MIITCDECATSFRLDESLLKPQGSKVRCSMCRHVFKAFPPLADAGTDLEPEPLSVADLQFDAPQEVLPESRDQEMDDVESDITLDFDDTDFDEDLNQDSSQADIEIDFEDEDTDFDLETEINFETEDDRQIDFDSDELELNAMDSGETQETVKADEPDLLSGLEMDSAPETPDQETPSETLALTDTDEDADRETGPATEDRPDPEPEDDISDFDLSFDLDEKDIPDQAMLDDDFLEKTSLDEEDDLDIGDEFDDRDFDEDDLDDTDHDMSKIDDSSHTAPPPRRPARASLIQPLDPAVEMADDLDAPPQKQPVLGTPVLLLLLIFLLAAGGYIAAIGMGYKIPFLPEIKIPFIQQYLSRETAEPLPASEPVPDQKSVTGRFVTNDTAGELFIITGKIENPSHIPYSHIQVKGTLFQKEKIAAVTQTAYCGNIVPENDLKTGNIPDIMAQLKLPRGTADTNVNVQPNDTVPFMLVFSDLPKNLENFTVEVVGFEKTGT